MRQQVEFRKYSDRPATPVRSDQNVSLNTQRFTLFLSRSKMVWFRVLVVCFIVVVLDGATLPSTDGQFRANDTVIATKFLYEIETRGSNLSVLGGEASWNYYTDLTPEKEQLSIETSTRVAEYFLEASNKAAKLLTEHVDLPHDIARQIRFIRRNANPKSPTEVEALEKLIANMTATYSNGKVCKSGSSNKSDCLPLEPDLQNIMANSRDYDELLWAWQGWREAVGRPLKDPFIKLVDLLNKGAREQEWGDYGHYMRSEYEIGNDLNTTVNQLWDAVKPLYEELHAYVRYHLNKKYNKSSPDGPIEAHLLGNMWSQDWSSLYDIVTPFPNVEPIDVTPSLKKHGYTAKKMFQLAESFFVSLGLYPMPGSFWEKSVLEKPKDRPIVCHASAWSFANDDVRIKMCTSIVHSHLITVHHEMGHIEYDLAYKDLPFAYRDGANPGFHEAIGDTIALSVETPNYLKSVDLLTSSNRSDEATINFLLMQALRRVANLPFTFLVDQWRWKVLAGTLKPSEYNTEWWKARLEYQGVKPPTVRTDEDFDPGAKFHIAKNGAYIGYFVSLILQFQFHRSLCGMANHKGPLHECSIYNSKEAGKKFKEMLQAGRSRPWKQTLYRLTGERDMTASALMDYFEPLRKWLYTYRNAKKYQLGWKVIPKQTHDVKAARKSHKNSWKPKNSNKVITLPDLKTAMKQLQPETHVATNESAQLMAKSSIEAAKPMFLPNKVKDQLNLG